MKLLFLSITLLLVFSEAQATLSTVKVPYSACAKSPYANGIGGTMHSRYMQNKKLQESAQKLATFSQEEALVKLQKQHPTLNLLSAKVTVKGCFVYYRVLSPECIYYFDAGNLALLETKGR